MVPTVDLIPEANPVEPGISALAQSGAALLAELVRRSEVSPLGVWDRWCIADAIACEFQPTVDALKHCCEPLDPGMRTSLPAFLKQLNDCRVDLAVLALDPAGTAGFRAKLKLLRQRWLNGTATLGLLAGPGGVR